MTARDFCFWLQGLYELGKPVLLNEEQTKLIKLHLDLVFKHEIVPAANSGEKKDADPLFTQRQQIEAARVQAQLQQLAVAQRSGCGVGGTLIC